MTSPRSRRKTKELRSDADLESDRKNQLRDAFNRVSIVVVYAIPSAILLLFIYIMLGSHYGWKTEQAQDFLYPLITFAAGFFVGHLKKSGIESG